VCEPLPGLEQGIPTWHSILLCVTLSPLGLLTHFITQVIKLHAHVHAFVYMTCCACCTHPSLKTLCMIRWACVWDALRARPGVPGYLKFLTKACKLKSHSHACIGVLLSRLFSATAAEAIQDQPSPPPPTAHDHASTSPVTLKLMREVGPASQCKDTPSAGRQWATPSPHPPRQRPFCRRPPPPEHLPASLFAASASRTWSPASCWSP
jgi:hypothetical protein